MAKIIALTVNGQDYQVSWDGYQYRILKMIEGEEPETFKKYPTNLASVMKLILQEEVTDNPRKSELVSFQEYAEFIDKSIHELKHGIFPEMEQDFRDNPAIRKFSEENIKKANAARSKNKASETLSTPSEPEVDELGDI